MKDKILILSMAGLMDLPEETRPLHVYFASLKECVVPHYDTKVILYNSSVTSEHTNRLVIEYGLEDVVEVKQLEDMELPERSYEFMKSVDYWGNRIGLVMNMMFDYAKNRHFFGARWIFQTDTDIEFLPNFSEVLAATESMRMINPALVLTQAGDVYEYNIVVGENVGHFKAPRRLELYNQNDPLEPNWQSFKFTPQKTNTTGPLYGHFNTQQLKTRNDFVGLTQEAAFRTNFNWIHAVSFIKIHNATGFEIKNYATSELEAQFPDQVWQLENKNFGIGINKDKGSLVVYELHSGIHNLIQIQLAGAHSMMNHINGGWTNDHYNPRALSCLSSKYPQYQHIWSQDYKE